MNELITERFIHTNILEQQIVKERILGERQRNRLFVVVFIFLTVVFFVLLVWPRQAAIDLGYKISYLNQEQKELLRINRELKLEIAYLKSPSRLERLGREEFNLFPPDPSQIIVVQ